MSLLEDWLLREDWLLMGQLRLGPHHLDRSGPEPLSIPVSRSLALGIVQLELLCKRVVRMD